jgi:hypothetical protein
MVEEKSPRMTGGGLTMFEGFAQVWTVCSSVGLSRG